MLLLRFPLFFFFFCFILVLSVVVVFVLLFIFVVTDADIVVIGFYLVFFLVEDFFSFFSFEITIPHVLFHVPY